VRLGDVAEVVDSVINTRLAGWYNDQPGVLLWVYKQPDANVVETVDAVKSGSGSDRALAAALVKCTSSMDRTL